MPAVLPRTAVGSYPAFSPLPFLADLGGVFSVPLSVASRRPAVSRHPALWGPDFPPCTKVHSGCLADFLTQYIAATPLIFNALQNFFRLALICRRARPKIEGERIGAFLAVAISNLRFHFKPRFGGAFFLRVPAVPGSSRA